jgi:diguanylate cyclase (GGDEF)-like protein
MLKINKRQQFTVLTNDTLMACLEIGKLLTSTLNLNEILELIMAKLSRLIAAENWSLLLLDREKNELIFEVVVGIDKDLVKAIHIPLGKGIAGRVAETGEPIFVEDAQKDARLYKKVDQITGFTTRSIICLPLVIHGNILGVIEIINIKDFVTFKTTYLPVLKILFDYAAIAIENSQFFTKIQNLSIRDEYTGLYNARYLHKILEDLIKNSKKMHSEIALVFVDIDNFKTVVDTYGHLAGSQLLKEIGLTISQILDKDDILIKYGGDEYIIIFPATSQSVSLKKITKILKAVRTSEYLIDESKPVKVTASFGMAMYPKDASTKKDLLLKADHSMYKVKNTTKNGIGLATNHP